MKFPYWCLALLIAINSFAGEYENGWSELDKGNVEKAEQLFKLAMTEQPNFAVEARMSLLMINIMKEKRDGLALISDVATLAENPAPYIYSTWSDSPVTGVYQNKSKPYLEFFESITNSEKMHQNIASSAMYTIGHHYLVSNQTDKAQLYQDNIGALVDWAFVGPFDNSSGSGFDKNYEPIRKAAPDAKFTSSKNSEIHWFTPAVPYPEAWTIPYFYFDDTEAVIYGQTFIASGKDQEAFLAVGGSGSIKIWLNDELILAEERELSTDMDFMKQKVRIPAGCSRIVFQLAYTSETSYPNFMVRLLDENSKPIENISHASKQQDYTAKQNQKISGLVPHYGHEYFLNLIEQEPDNLLNYLLMSKVYNRSTQYNQSIEILQRGLKKSPNNILLHYELLLTYNRLNDRVELLKQIDDFRKFGIDFYFLLSYDFSNALESENYVEALSLLNKIGDNIGYRDARYYSLVMKYYGKKQDFQQVLDLIDKAYSDHPNNTEFLHIKYRLLKSQKKPTGTYLGLLEDFLKHAYSRKIANSLIEEYGATGAGKKKQKLYLRLHEWFPAEIEFMNNLSAFYFQQKDYAQSLKYADKALANSPFNASLWLNRSYINEGLKNKDEAISDLTMAIHYSPNLFSARERLREMEGKNPLLSYFQSDSTYDIIEAERAVEGSKDDNYDYLINNANWAIFPEGASVEHRTIAIRILKESSIEYWQEASIPINRLRQVLNVYKSEIIKPGGQKVKGERNFNELVFPDLAVGDVVYIEYQIENYAGGKLGKEFYADFAFNSFAPSNASSFRVFSENEQDFNIKTRGTVHKEPLRTKVDDLFCYEWRVENPEKCISESYMPNLYEVGTVLSLSTIKSWNTISEWYRDLAMPMAKEEYNVKKAYKEIFDGSDAKTDYDKAKLIYDYISENVTYSYLSFRQSNYVPQKPMKTISTRLGDCKDLSILYYTLAKMAGISTNLVLVNTRDNGENSILTPSISFNHCIIKINLENGEMYQELTDSKLPFGSLPGTVVKAQALIIPNSTSEGVGELIHIPEKVQIEDEILRKIKVEIQGTDLVVHNTLTVTGEGSSDYRYHFDGLTNYELTETVKNMIMSSMDNQMILDTFVISELNSRDASFEMMTAYTVKDAVQKIGGMSVLKPNYVEELYSSDSFVEEERKYPLLYWHYEPTQYYRTEIEYNLPPEISIIELPKESKVKNDFLNYSLTVSQADNRNISLVREAFINTKNIDPQVYSSFKTDVDLVLKSCEEYIVFK